MDKTKCPFCNREFTDILKHYVLVHDIKNMNHFVEEIEKVQKKESAKVEFRKYVNNLKKKMKEGTISAKEYRELIMRWCKENSEG